MPNYYLVESAYFAVSHGLRESQGVLGDTKGTEKTYLHVLPLTEAEVKALRARPDANGNPDHTRFALRGRDDFWIAVDGTASWPGIFRKRLTSRFVDTEMGSMPTALTDAELALLRAAGLQGI